MKSNKDCKNIKESLELCIHFMSFEKALTKNLKLNFSQGRGKREFLKDSFDVSFLQCLAISPTSALRVRCNDSSL